MNNEDIFLNIIITESPDRFSTELHLNVKEFLKKHDINENVFFIDVFAYTLSRFVGEDNVLFDIVNNKNLYHTSFDCKNQDIYSFIKDSNNSIYNALKNKVDGDTGIVFNYGKNEINYADFNFNIAPNKDKYILKIIHVEKYPKQTVERFINSFKLIAHDFCNVENLEDINYITSHDLELLDSYNQTEHKLDYDDILDAFNDNLAKYPNNNLVKMDDRVYTYAEGAFIADKIAKMLIDLKIDFQSNVAFLVERSEWYLLCALGIMSVGASYVPLDDAHPDKRIKFILNDAECRVVLVSDETFERAQRIVHDDIIILNVSNILKDNISTLSSLNIVPGDLTCILYTSGTTGIPKGVKITRKSILNLATVYQDEYGLSNDDVYGLFSNIGFDAALLAMVVVLFSGACLSIVPNNIRLDMNRLNNYFINQNVTHTLITTQVGKLFMQMVESTSLNVLLVGGEKLGEFRSPKDYLLVDAFGPTEACVFISSIRNSDKIDFSSIGHLGYNTKAYILDNEKRRVPIGAVGELCLAGYQISDGYLNREDENIKSFIKNPFDDSKDYGVMYCSGDMARILPDGTLGIIGRRDGQVKIRGNRVELCEIETTIREIDYVEDVTVQTIKNGTNNELVAYVVTNKDFDDNGCIKNYVAINKPEYMVPSFVINLDEIPLNVNGKVDKNKLPDVDLSSLSAEYVAPTNDNEELVVNAFEKVFNREKIGINDNFVQLGGDSLIAIKLLAFLEGYNISSAEILNLKTPKAIAKNIKENDFNFEVYSLESGCPLNEPQLNVYLDIIAHNKVDSYFAPFSIKISKKYSVEDICGILDEMLKIHPILNMRVSDEYDVPYLIKGDKPPVTIKDDGDVNHIYDFLKEPFDLYKNLSRYLIFENKDDYTLFIVLHHIICDELSLKAFKDNFRKLLHGYDIDVDDSFLKVAAFSQQIQEKEEYAEARQFYDLMLAESDEVNYLIDDVETKSPGISSCELNVDLSEFLSKNNISENVLFTAVFAYTLSRFVEGNDVLFNLIENGRSRFNNFESIGMFANTLPILVDCKNQSVSSFMEYMSNLVYDIMKYNYYPFRILANEYDVDSSILFQYVPNWINAEENYVEEFREDIIGEMRDVIGDLVVFVIEQEDNYKINIEYSDKFSSEFVKRFIESYRMILQGIVNVDKLGDINYITSSDLMLLDSYNETSHDLKYSSILEAFNDNLSKNPDKILTISDEVSYTYAESAYLINELNRLLKDNNVSHKDRVGIFVNRDHWVFLSALSCVSQGITYIPIDENYPDKRIAFMIEQSSLKFIITNDSFESRINNLIDDFNLNLTVINVASLNDNIMPSDYVDYVDETVNEVACIIYTSGTTGLPKAVQMTRRQLVNFMQFYAESSNFTSDDIQAIFVSIGFDISLEQYVSVFAGGSLLFVPNEIRLNLNRLNEYYMKHNVTHTFITTQIAKLFIDTISETSLKYLRTGGEKLGSVKPPEGYILTDLYGPAEYNAVSAMDINKKEYESSVGQLNWNTKTYILDEEQRRVPLGAVGEIYVSGFQITPGYLDNPKANEKVLFENPFDGDVPGYEKMYKTGDIARYLPNGTIGIVGRSDTQVKIRGNRVELSEIEITIRNLDFIEDVTVQTTIRDGNNELVAYVVASDDFDGNLTEYIQNKIREKKPDYMVPSYVIALDKIPLTVNGKVDKRSLPDVDVNVLRAEYVAPTTETEKILVKTFEKVFNQEKLGIYDDFISLGGDSLIATKIMAILSKNGINLDFRIISEAHTPYKIAQYIDNDDFEYGFMLAKKGNITQNMFLIPPIGGLSPIFSKLIDKIDFEGNIYVIDDFKYSISLSELRNVKNGDSTLDMYYYAIRKLFKDGDIIAGYSLGTVFGLLLAEKLEKDNKNIDKCIFIDSDLLFDRNYEVSTEEVINEFVGDLDEYPDDFVDKFSEIIRINSYLNFHVPKIKSHVTFLTNYDLFEETLAGITSDYDYILIDSTHQRIINEDVDKIVEYF